ncbi:MurR/RpiR family transcriptional regulator [Acinetobacter nectaris]|uniref:MurR/RpiR family transcriptional regulator n=1 Tax=Acinetobacter nectaris TaxID=1219382 RepID=UPI001F34ED38|nr:MurR/RpiR family transcriptional regulator [Acinetobacter nectaris]MCF9033412.1 MurR/RpiR family transcriptional regulator [Acinetobacter nectaris]
MMNNLEDQLKAEYIELTPQEKKVADFILDHIHDLVTYNSAEIARFSHVSKATVSRLFKRLGYTSYKALREHTRALRQQGIPVVENKEILETDSLLQRHYEQEKLNLQVLMQYLASPEFSNILDALQKAKKIAVTGFRNSYAVALHLRQQLLQARSDVYLYPQSGQTIAEELVDLTKEDVFILFAFRRRPQHLKEILQYLKNNNVPVLLVSEEKSLELTQLSSWHIQMNLDSISAFDSYTTAMSFCNFLSNAFLHASLNHSRERVQKISQCYVHLNELE